MRGTRKRATLQLKEYLQKSSKSFSYERKLVLDAVVTLTGSFSAVDIINYLEAQRTRISRATVYRCIKILDDAEIVREKYQDNHLTFYECTFHENASIHILLGKEKEKIHFFDDRMDRLVQQICGEKNIQSSAYNIIIRAEKNP